MTKKKRTDTPEYQWEQALLDAYYDHSWRDVLEPLAEQFERWKLGELDHEQISNAIHRTHKATQRVYTFFGEKREFLLRAIPLNHDWFQTWVKANPPPQGYDPDFIH